MRVVWVLCAGSEAEVFESQSFRSNGIDYGGEFVKGELEERVRVLSESDSGQVLPGVPRKELRLCSVEDEAYVFDAGLIGVHKRENREAGGLPMDMCESLARLIKLALN